MDEPDEPWEPDIYDDYVWWCSRALKRTVQFVANGMLIVFGVPAIALVLGVCWLDELANDMGERKPPRVTR